MKIQISFLTILCDNVITCVHNICITYVYITLSYRWVYTFYIVYTTHIYNICICILGDMCIDYIYGPIRYWSTLIMYALLNTMAHGRFLIAAVCPATLFSLTADNTILIVRVTKFFAKQRGSGH